MNVHCETSKIINGHGKYVHVYCDKSEFLHFQSEMFWGNCVNVHCENSKIN